MRSLTGLLLLAVPAVACGKVTNEPPPPDGLVVPGGECADVGADASAEDGCNACVCGDAGWSCTELACPAVPMPCPEGAFDDTADGCNTCTCTDGSWVCTDEACPPVTECTPGATKSAGDSCNTCTCSGDGTRWDCTVIGCPLCETGFVRSGDDECTCTCQSGGWLCTASDCSGPACPPVSCEPSDQRSCDVGATEDADDECNTCACMPDRRWACTNIDCNPVTCGGFAGDTCGEDEYCAYEANQGGCGILDASAICKKRPTACTEEEAPVCGCDGETYSNACLANLAGTGVYTDQPCLPDE